MGPQYGTGLVLLLGHEKFEMAPGFLENLYTPVLDWILI